MSDSPTSRADAGDDLPASGSPADQSPSSSSSHWSVGTLRWGRRVFALVVAIVAALIVSLFTVDLGTLWSGLPALAAEQASKFLKRPMHIGRISAKLTPGEFVLQDVVIEGLTPDARPFFAAKRIEVHVPWWTMVRMKIDIEVDITDWTMAVETWEGGRHSMPNLKFGDGSPREKSRWTTTVRFAYAKRGNFYYHDHATPWSVDARNLEFSLVRAYSLQRYVGLVSVSQGITQIQQFLPMTTDMSTRFVLDGGKVHLEHLDLKTDGSVSHITGDVDFRNWPDQTYYVRSTVDFARMKEIFFQRERWRVDGDGEFTGVFRYPKNGRRELSGQFRSDLATVNRLELGDLHGALTWTRDLFAVTHAEAHALGGQTQFTYSLVPLGTRTGATASFDADYSGVDLFQLDRLVALRGLRLRGAADGRVSMSWPNGRLSTGLTGEGHTDIRPPGNVELATAQLPSVPRPIVPEPAPFDGTPRTSTLTFGADLHYRFDANGVTFDRSTAATPYTYVSFEGQLASQGDSRFPFRVVSADWQESDRLLSAIMTAIGRPTGAVEVGGRGTFDGLMTGRFSSPRIAGRFDGDAVRAWGVTWGAASADVVIEGGYVTLSRSRVGDGPDRSIVPEGQFSLGFRTDGRDEINAKVTIINWPASDLKVPFSALDGWSMDGTVGRAELALRGQYRQMFGGGPVSIVDGTAWGETFKAATASVELEGTGLRIKGLEILKGENGNVRGDANVVWDGTYGFKVAGRDIAIESLDNFTRPGLPLTGTLSFTAQGAGSFDAPVYALEGSVQDFFIGDEGVGPVSGRLSVADDLLTLERVFITSPRFVALLGSGTIALDDAWTSTLSLRFQDASLAPFLKFVLPAGNDVSPYARIEASGSLTVSGPLSDRLALQGAATVDEARLTLYDYPLASDGPIQLALDRGVVSIGRFNVKGENTNLALTGGADARAATYDLHATGNANLAILQLFYPNLTASGAVSLNASLTGPVAEAVVSGQATISNGRLRRPLDPHGLEAINGSLTFGSDEVRLCEPAVGAPCQPLTGRVGSGEVRFGGAISLDGVVAKEFNLTAQGRSMRLRYPAGFNSTVDMDLFLTGPVDALHLSGDVDVLRLSYVGAIDADAVGRTVGLLAISEGGIAATPTLPRAQVTSVRPITLDIRVSAPQTRLIETRTARIDGQADLRVRGTFDQPQMDGQVDILGGEYEFNGNRIFVRDGSMIDFRQADRLEPVFDILAETRVRVTGQTFTVTIGLRGTLDGLNLSLTSEPLLPEADIVTLLFGGTPDWGSAEQRALGSSQEQQQRMFQTAGAALLTSVLTSRVGDVFERTGALDTVQITPLLNDAAAFQRLDPGARLTLGKRISPRVFLTYSRTFNTGQEEIILLEYDQSDRMSWVLSRNEDRTYALDFRIRYVF